MPAKPTNVRWAVFFALLVLCTINYVVRAVLAICMPAIQDELNLDPAVVGLVLSAFFWGYAAMQIPAGWLVDRLPVDKLLVVSAVFWGVFQTMTGFLSSSSMFIAVRILLGVTEAPMYPAASKMQSIWLTSKERGRGSAMFDSGAAMGNAVGGPIVIVFMAWFGGWRGAMIGAGLVTIAVAWGIWRVLNGTPDTHPRVNQAEREYLRRALTLEYDDGRQDRAAVGIRQYLSSPSFWLMNLGYYCVGVFWFGIITWGPNYLAAEQHLDIKAIGGAVFVIYGVGVIAEIIGGYLTDLWRERGGHINTVMRTQLFLEGLGMAGAMYMVTRATTPVEALAWLTIAVAIERVAGCLYWSIPAAVAQRKDVGTVAGCMNTCGNIAGALTPILIGFIVSSTGSYHWVLMMFVASGIGMSLFSVFIDYGRKIGSAEVAAAGNGDNCGPGLDA